MSDLRTSPANEPIHLTVEALPADVARQLRDCQEKDPDFLRRILLYAATHRAVFETLSQAWRV